MARHLLAPLDARQLRAERGGRWCGDRRGHHATSPVSEARVDVIRLRASGTLKALSRSGWAWASSASAAAAKRSAVAGPAAQLLLRAPRAPRAVGDAAERDPAVADRAVLDVERGGDRHDGERERRAVAHLAVRRVGGEPGRERLELDRGDELAALEDGVALRVVAGQAVQARDRDRPLALPAGDVDLRADRGQRRRPCRTGASRRTRPSARGSRGCDGRPRVPGNPSRGVACCTASTRPGSTRSACAGAGCRRSSRCSAAARTRPTAATARAAGSARGRRGARPGRCCGRPRRSAVRRRAAPRCGRTAAARRRRGAPASPRRAS